MADQILRRDKNQTTARTGKAIQLQLAGQPTASTYDDEWILPDHFLSPEQARLTTNEGNISSNRIRIENLENSNKLQRNLSLNTSTSFTLIDNGVITSVNITVVTGTSVTVKVGTSLGGGELVDYSGSDVLNAGNYRSDDIIHRNTVVGGNSASQTIYYTVSGGTVHMHLFYKILATT